VHVPLIETAQSEDHAVESASKKIEDKRDKIRALLLEAENGGGKALAEVSNAEVDAGDETADQLHRKSSSDQVSLKPTIYNNIHDMPLVTSSGPSEVNPELGGLHEFTNVCVTHHQLESQIQGVLLFEHDNIDLKNDGRCVPCAAPLMIDQVVKNCEDEVHHNCGFEGKVLVKHCKLLFNESTHNFLLHLCNFPMS